jgi:repressor LexA
MMRDELTDRQQAILHYIKESIQERGFPPSIREISAQFGISSTQGVQRHLEALEKKGYVKKDPRAARSLQITQDQSSSAPIVDEVRQVPILGNVAAGKPISVVESNDGLLPIASDWLSMGKDYFLLRVRGNSMAEAIQPGDMVLVERQSRPEVGELVVAMIEDEVTVKRFYPSPDRIILRSDNPTYEDIVVQANLNILGKVTALIRKYGLSHKP